jgi:hypothetical protein
MRGVGADENPRIVGTVSQPFLHEKAGHYFGMNETQVRDAMKRFM